MPIKDHEDEKFYTEYSKTFTMEGLKVSITKGLKQSTELSKKISLLLSSAVIEICFKNHFCFRVYSTVQYSQVL